MRERSRLVLVIPALHGGGAERVIKHLINHLDRERYEIFLILFNTDNADVSDVVLEHPPLSLRKRSRWDFFAMLVRLRRLLQRTRPDVVLSFLDFTNILVVLASLGANRRFRVIVNERNFPREHLRRVRLGGLKAWLLRRTYRWADLVLSNSIATGRSLATDFGVPYDKLRTVYNPIWVEEVQEFAEADVVHPFFNRGPVIIGVGRLNEQKRFDLLIRAFAETKARFSMPLSLLILGEGTGREELVRLAEELGVAKAVDFPGFQLNPYAWMKRSSLFVLSSDYEGFPNVVLEAMACGVPVVATDCRSGPNEIITHGVNGSLVPVGEWQTLAREIERVLKDAVLRQRYSEEGKRRAQDFRIERILPEYEHYLSDEAMAGGPAVISEKRHRTEMETQVHRKSGGNLNSWRP